MIYNVDIQERAEYDLLRLAKEEPNAFLKAQSLIQELREHPKTGTGHPEPLKGKPEGRWSRRISKKTSTCLSDIGDRGSNSCYCCLWPLRRQITHNTLNIKNILTQNRRLL